MTDEIARDDGSLLPNIHIVAGNPTPAEVAAVAAVLSGVLEELVDLDDATPAVPSAWARSQRPIRRPLHPGAGAWRGFSG